MMELLYGQCPACAGLPDAAHLPWCSLRPSPPLIGKAKEQFEQAVRDAGARAFAAPAPFSESTAMSDEVWDKACSEPPKASDELVRELRMLAHSPEIAFRRDLGDLAADRIESLSRELAEANEKVSKQAVTISRLKYELKQAHAELSGPRDTYPKDQEFSA